MARARPGDPLMQCILKSIALHIAVLDIGGRITYASKTWRRLAKLHGIDERFVRTGADYPLVAAPTHQSGSPFGTAAATGISRVLRREIPHFSLQHAWRTRTRTRWYLMRVNPMPEWHGGVVISHVDITDPVQVQEDYQASCEFCGGSGMADDVARRYQDIFEAAGSAIWEADFTAAFRLVEDLRQSGITDLHVFLTEHPEIARDALDQTQLRDANPQAVRMIGIPKSELLHHALMKWMINAEYHFIELLAAIAEGRDHYTAEAQFRMVCGGVVDVVFTARFPGGHDASDHVLLCAHDVTEVVSTRRRYELATAAGGVSVFEYDLLTHELRADPVMNTLVGLPLDTNNTIAEWEARVHPEDRPVLRDHVARLPMARHKPPDALVTPMEYRLLHTDGGIRWVLSRSTLVCAADGTPVRVVGTITDITRLKTTEEALRRSHAKIQELAGRLIEAQETERRRIARELHDDINQRLAGAAIALSNLERQLDAPRESIQERLAELQSQLGDLITSVRRLSHEMHPGVLEHAGLIPALRSLSRDFAAEGFDVQVEAFDVTQSIPDEIALCCYRLVQEALRNVVKNTPTRFARVTLAFQNSALALQIVVPGLAPLDPDWRIGLGLVALRERVRLVGGDLRVSSSDRDTAEIRAVIPVSSIDTPAAAY